MTKQSGKKCTRKVRLRHLSAASTRALHASVSPSVWGPDSSFVTHKCGVRACTRLWGSVGKCCRTCSLGSKTNSLPPAIFLSGSNLPVSVRLSFALTTQWHLLQLLLLRPPALVSLGPPVHLSASHHAALNFCKQLTQPAPVLWPTGKAPT